MKKIILTVAFIASGLVASAQVGIGNEDPKATLDVSKSAGTDADGVLVPRVTVAELNTKAAAYTADQNGALVFITAITGAAGKTSNVTSTGFYYYNSGTSKWTCLGCVLAAPAVSVVLNEEATYAVLGTEDIILSNVNGGCTMTLPVSAAVGKRIVIANNTNAGGLVSIAVAPGGNFWNGFGFATAPGNSNIFTYTASGWINEAIGLN